MEITNFQSVSTYRIITFDMLFNYWLNLNGNRVLKVRTIEKYLCNYNNYIKDIFGNMDIRLITRKQIIDYFEWLKIGHFKRHIGLSSSSICNIRANLHSCFEFAVEYGLIDNNPINLIKSPKIIQNEVETFNLDERKKLEKYLIDNFNIHTIGFYIMFYSGLRLGELVALKWENVDLNNRFIKIEGSMNIYKSKKTNKWEYFNDTTKTNNSNRIIPIPFHLIEIFNKIKALNIDSPFVLANSKGECILPRNYRPRFLNILSKLNIRPRKIHAIRHTFATTMIENGMNVKTLSIILGHANINTTINIYLHSSLDRKINLVNNIPFIYEEGNNHDI